MVQVGKDISLYIDNKVKELIFQYGNEHISIYIHLYEAIPDINLRSYFSFLHYELNSLFIIMNSRIRNGHYKAAHSAKLLILLDNIKTVQANLRNSKYEFQLHTYYAERIKEMEHFLQESYGSTIPDGFEKIDIIEIEPVFTLPSSLTVSRNDSLVSFPIKLIGQGSYANVYKYKDTLYNRFFALKRAYNNLTPKEYERFEVEYKEMKKLNSPYVIEVYRYNKDKHEYIMEYADDTLENFISNNNNTLEISERIGLVRQILQAFIYINSKEILHRDISARNILIKKYDGLNVIKVSDFGLVKREESGLTSKNTELKGSLNDPKLELIGFDNYEVRHETYALTRLIYFVVTGKIKINTFKTEEFRQFINRGISDTYEERYISVEALKNQFNAVMLNYS